ncbi:hypothetical protein PR048_021145 [Dryococelus australis]|uniref:Uncharacterized protein n=1 Tax=Dryococelus australis TaxID=614101 RepID=A0ABQ9GXH1_9NEOP|nr:hypothetical protein PR048_021145 [Dryococelus australis]
MSFLGTIGYVLSGSGIEELFRKVCAKAARGEKDETGPAIKSDKCSPLLSNLASRPRTGEVLVREQRHMDDRNKDQTKKKKSRGKPGSISGGAAPGYSHVGDSCRMMPLAGLWVWVFSGISRFPLPLVSALPYAHLASPSSALRPSTAGMQGRGKHQITERTRQTASSSGADSRMRKSGSCPRRESNPVRLGAEARTLITTTSRLHIPAREWLANAGSVSAVARALASHHGDPDSIPAGSFPDLRMWETCCTMPLAGGSSRGTPVSPALAFLAPLRPRVSFHVMSGDDVHLWVSAGKPVTRRGLPHPGFPPHSTTPLSKVCDPYMIRWTDITLPVAEGGFTSRLRRFTLRPASFHLLGLAAGKGRPPLR